MSAGSAMPGKAAQADVDLRALEAQVLEMISSGDALPAILDAIARTADAVMPQVLSSILLVDGEGRLQPGAAPSLPDSYNQAVYGLPIGPCAGSCGTAAWRREQVIVTDIDTDPLWADYRSLTSEHDLRACWSTPVLDRQGTVLATFAMYYRSPRAPDPQELAFTTRVAHFVRLAIERTRQNERLRESEERFRIVAQATSDVVWDWNLVTGEVWWNEGMRTLFGHASAGGPDIEDWRAHIHPGDRERVFACIDEVLQGRGERWRADYRFRRADGSHALVADHGFLIRDANGRPLRMLGSMVDVTDQRRLEEQLRQSQRLDAVGQLTGGVAHDFNNLLTVILGNTELLIEELADSRLRALAEMTRTAARRGADLTSRLLAFSRRQALDPKPIDVNRLVGGMDALLRRTLGARIEIEVVQGGGLWRALADAAQLESAILNLCLNARDAMPEGGRLTIETANAALDEAYVHGLPDVQAGQYVLVTVSDTGVGMDAATIAQAFEPFFTTKEVGKGSGLGLSMVYGYAKQSRGHVRICSEPGQGTSVKLYLPRAEGQSQEAQVPGEDTPDVDVAAGHGARILLVEDDDLVRTHVAQQLRRFGHAVTSAAHAAQALEILQRGEPFELLFTDIVMPGGMGGRELAEHARRLRPGLPVLFTSGYTDDASMHHGRLEPGIHFLHKPYRRQELADKLRLVLNRPDT